MFQKVLVANRGVIACRIMRTLHAHGLDSVAVYSDADRHGLHVRQAKEAVYIGEAQASQSYLNMDAILKAALDTGAGAIHPGYGFLSENASFARRCAEAGICFIGPRPEHMEAFGLKHTARELAVQNGIPLLPGTGLLTGLEDALVQAEHTGYPLMLKSTAGGGGIGMRLVHTPAELADAWAAVSHLAQTNFKNGGLYLEKYVSHARHIEVQIFGDGKGTVIALGERDCSIQRRNQKVIEETPAPGLSSAARQALAETALRLMRSIGYLSAGTVEFVLDQQTGQFYFLEVNTRLQVEHGVTEEVTGTDLVWWMVEAAAGEWQAPANPLKMNGHAIQVRVYAENPLLDFQPDAGLLTAVNWPELSDNNLSPGTSLRIEHCVATGLHVPPFYDPMIAKLIIHAPDRDQAIAALHQATRQTRIAGIENNLDFVAQVLDSPTFRQGQQTTRFLDTFHPPGARILVKQPGLQTTVQDVNGRTGYWHVGVPPSGAMDSFSLQAGNALLGNPVNAAGLEITLKGPVLQFFDTATVCITGAPLEVQLNGQPVAMYQPVRLQAGDLLQLGEIKQGMRAYMAIAGGLDIPEYLGSQATFTLGQFGGHCGRSLQTGDVLHYHAGAHQRSIPANSPEYLPVLLPAEGKTWEIAVRYGPHGAPDFFTPEDISTFFDTAWEVHYNSSRTGIRLKGPKPCWARTDGGEAGLHPSNIHDNAYAIGAIDFTGDMPVILGVDGPSLGGFVCPAVVIRPELWKLGQLRPGDRVRFVPVSQQQSDQIEESLVQIVEKLRAGLHPPTQLPQPVPEPETLRDAILARRPADGQTPSVTYRPAGDQYLLVEYGDNILDLALRFRVHALMQWLQLQQIQGLAGLIDLTPGVRSLQVHFEPTLLSPGQLLTLLQAAEQELQDIHDLNIPSRTVWLPLAWNDSQTRLAIEKYMQSVRADAPWCPDNLEFIRRINGLDSIEDVKAIVYGASYLVMGLGDVYLGAPVATPLDPRHRLITTKYNPARTWTPENAVGIGGAYMCIYGMEGPGGYQFVGRTLQMWNRYNVTTSFTAGKPWLLEFFDQIRFYEVSEEELLQLREQFGEGTFQIKTEAGFIRLGDYEQFLADSQTEIEQFRRQQQQAFAAERERWQQAGHGSDAEPEEDPDLVIRTDQAGTPIESHIPGSIWRILVTEGQKVTAGETVAIIESMKMEFPVTAATAGKIGRIYLQQGQPVRAGQALMQLEESEGAAA